MQRRMAGLVAVLAVALLGACNTREIKELRVIRRAQDEELVKRRILADNLNPLRRDREVLQRKLEPLVASSPAPVARTGAGAEKLLAELRAIPESARYLVSSFEVAESGASSGSLAPANPMVAVGSPARSAPARPPLKLPEPSFLSGEEGQRLRLEILRTEKEIADLERIVAEVEKYAAENEKLQVKLEELDRLSWARLGEKAGLVEALFAGPKPLLKSGRLDRTTGGFKVTGKLSPGAKLDDLRAIVPRGYQVQKLEEQAGTVTLEATVGK